MGVRLPLTSSDDISCGEDKGVLKAFICSEISHPNNSTVIYSNTSDFNAIKDKLGCENAPVIDVKANKPGYDQWVTSVSIWVWEAVEMFVLLEGSIRVNPKAKREILGAAFTTSAITMAGIYGTGVALAESGKEIPRKWTDLIKGLTKLKASLCVGGWALGIAGGVTGKNELVLSGLLMNVISNTFRETGEGALITLPLILDKKYAAIALSLIPAAIIASQLIPFKPRVKNPYVKAFAWFVTATLGTGLFSGAWHEFEEVAGESSTVWDVGKHTTVGNDYEILSHEKLPMSFITPFGYRPNPTVITLTSGLGFFTFVSLASLYRFIYRVKFTGFGQIMPSEGLMEL
ncbi:hypothetical protein [Endozoicomonas sp. 4G]|uniref:hypothetical protein n=1 Tax=Endozoicomonas sp. 4G TaxID=2872754 RepID=UPI002078C9E7|nr:hypothetical protein [Endozoicomonas sp. 4G]